MVISELVASSQNLFAAKKIAIFLYFSAQIWKRTEYLNSACSHKDDWLEDKIISSQFLFLYHLKTSKNFWFSDIFRGNWTEALAWHKLKEKFRCISAFLKNSIFDQCFMKRFFTFIFMSNAAWHLGNLLKKWLIFFISSYFVVIIVAHIFWFNRKKLSNW